MNNRQRVRSSLGILKSRLTGRPVPVAVRWNLLHRCAMRCAYCNLWNAPIEEFTFKEIRPILKDLRDLGTAEISFSGGEPLLRDDIGLIVDECVKLGISPTMNSSGFGIKRRIDALGGLDLLKISLDGPAEVHDSIRGRQGAHRAALDAAELGRARLRRVTFATTITRFNVRHLDYILETARQFNTLAAFQPVKSLYRGVKNLGDLAPSEEDMQTAIRFLISEKQSGNRHIRNTLSELEHIRHWPRYPKSVCSAGKIFMMINPDGTFMPCDRIAYASPLPNLRTVPVKEALKRLPQPHCAGCGFCGALELNALYSLKPRQVLETLALVGSDFAPWPVPRIRRR